MSKEIKGFSKLTKKEKIEWLSKSCFKDSDSAKKILTQYWNIDSNLQKLHDEFSRNWPTSVWRYTYIKQVDLPKFSQII